MITVRAIRASFLGATLLVACRAEGPPRTALIGATVIGGNGAVIQEDAVVLVRGTAIEAIGPRSDRPLPRGTVEIDVSGKWIVPGLIDAHVHAERWALPRYLASGVTTVRDLHGQRDSIFALAEESRLNAIASPRIFTGGAMIDGVPTTFTDALAAETPSDARRAVDNMSLARADYIVAFTRLTPPLLTALVDEAATFRLPVAAHLGLTDALAAAELGVTSIEQLTGIPEAIGPAGPYLAAHRRGFFSGWTEFERGWARLDSARLERIAVRLAQAGVFQVPTLTLHETYSRLNDPAQSESLGLEAVPPEVQARWNASALATRAGWTAADFADFRTARAKQDLFLRLFSRAGGSIAAGSDAGSEWVVPGSATHRELALLVGAGLTPAQALASATGHAARLLRADSLGDIGPGKVADLLILDADPLADIANTRAIHAVMVRGVLMSADSLRRSW